MKRINQNGFTLIELLIVVAIIGILAAIAVPNFLQAQVRANVARVQADHKSLSTSIEMYRLDCNTAPPSHIQAGEQIYNFEALFKSLTTPLAYLTNIPRDPFPHHSARELDQSIDFKDVVNGAYAYGYFRADRSGPGGQYDYGFHKWMASSSGPDGLLQYFAYFPQDETEGTELCAVCNIKTPAVLLVAEVYDPSNGLRSSGEIIRWSGQN
ncbi:MAG: prepilin-type N-terminal cleavage/methylation domain-containing protein [Candidatus Hinthialibacter antarcticus]|nr:prepilin-type N-terminal cleavage/methylation domain-containing protein [Candidatus Hinthialibacter antarcticus]